MAFEGEHKIIPVKGITRAGADTLCDDGAMNEVIGLEYKDGSYAPYAEGGKSSKLPVDANEKTSLLRVHKTSNGNNIIAYFKDNRGIKGLYWISEDEYRGGDGVECENWSAILQGVDVKDVEFVGNVICIGTDNGVLNYIFQEGKYEIWQVDKSKLPNISFRVDVGIGGKQDKFGILYANKYSAWKEDEKYNTAKSAIIASRGKAQEEGGLTGYFLVCAAYKLKTGEYIKASNPTLMCRPLHKHGKYVCDKNDETPYFSLYRESASSYIITRQLSIEDTNFVSVIEPYLLDVDSGPRFRYLAKVGDWYGEENGGSSGVQLRLKESSEVYKNIFSTDEIPFYLPMSCGIIEWYADSFNQITFSAPTPTSKLQYKINKDIVADESLIDSLCIFISNEIDPFKSLNEDNDLEKHITKASAYKNSTETKFKYYAVYPILKTNEELVKEIGAISTLYNVKEIPYDEIVKSSDWIDVELAGKLGESLPNRETLPLSAFDCSIINSASLASYNSRLHQYNYKQSNEIYLNIEDFNLQGGFGQYSPVGIRKYDSAYVIVDIEDTNGKSRIVKYFNSPMLSYNGVTINVMNPYISFHHPYAKKISMICTINSLNFFMSFDLKKSKLGGYSYFINNELKANETKETVGDISSITTPYNNSVYRNGIRVSETYDVNSFPYANTYVVGKGDIIGIASLSIPLSQDTFGSYPLLVFTTEGIYSLETDKTGSSAYTNVPPPFSREVCINKNTICEIDGAVLFASSKGLMIASAQGVQEFLPTLNGTPKHVPTDDTSRGLGLDLYYKIINHPLSTELYDSISHDDFIQFLSNPDTVVSYVSNKNKVIVYNKSHMYSYWIDIPTRIVTKLPISIAFDNNNYPTEQYVLSSGEVFEFGYLSRDTDVQCLLQSRPIKNTYGMKSNLRVIARGYFNSSDANNYAVMLVLGSYDAINWQPIGVCQRPFAGGFNDLGCVTDRVSHKYVMVIITGKMSPDSHIDGIEMTINNKYNNKLK